MTVHDDENSATFHLVLDQPAPESGDVLEAFEHVRGIQIWIVEGSTIRVGRIPRIFKATPIADVSYDDGWLTMRTHEEGLPIRHIFIVCEAKDKSAVEGIINNLTTRVGVRLMREETS